MIVPAFLMALALASAGVAVAQTEPEIVVTAQVERIGLTLGRDANAHNTCGLTRSSGDVAIDEAMCRRASRCLKRGTIDQTVVDACVARQKSALVAAWLRGERQ